MLFQINRIFTVISRGETHLLYLQYDRGKKRLLTELEETRRRGYSLNREEHLLNRAAIGAPIFERGGRLSAAVSLVGDPNHILGDKTEALATEVMTAAVEISRHMGFFLEAPFTEWMNRTRPSLIRDCVGVALNRPARNSIETS